MLKLGETELDNAMGAIQHHGYGDFFPNPPEWDLLVSHWPQVRTELAQVDLDLYSGYDVIFAFLLQRFSTRAKKWDQRVTPTTSECASFLLSS